MIGPATVVIPARNEAERVGAVVEAALEADPTFVDVSNVIVVDNDSIDGTSKVARRAGANTVLLTGRRGKGFAMKCAIEYAEEHIPTGPILFLDGDLRGLTGEHVTDLAQPVVEGQALMTIGYLGGRKPMAKHVYENWGMLAGQRCVSRVALRALRDPDFVKYRTEGALNAVLRNANLGEAIQRVELTGVTHIGQFDKAGTLQGSINYGQMILSGLRGLMTSSSI
jgi:glycosyltransferase involved in cell wall biosynthesis